MSCCGCCGGSSYSNKQIMCMPMQATSQSSGSCCGSCCGSSCGSCCGSCCGSSGQSCKIVYVRPMRYCCSPMMAQYSQGCCAPKNCC